MPYARESARKDSFVDDDRTDVLVDADLDGATAHVEKQTDALDQRA